MTQGQRVRLDGRFAKLWTASTASALGSGLTATAAPLLVASRTPSPLTVSITSAVTFFPWLLFSLPGGVLVDRVDRRLLLVAVDWLRFGLMGILAAAVLVGHASILLLFAVLFLVQTGEVLFRSASLALVQAVVPKDGLERANGWLSGGTNATQQMIAGPLAGFLFVTAASVPFFVNSLTYAASAILVGLIAGSYRTSFTPNDDPGDATRARSGGSVAVRGALHDIRAEILEGFRWLMSQRLLRTMAILMGLLNMTLAAALAILVLVAKDRLHLGSVGYGLLYTCMAVGAVIGSVWGDRLISLMTATWTLRIGLIVETLTHLVLATSHADLVVGFALLLFGVHGAVWGIVASSLRQRLTPPYMFGRVSSTTTFITIGGASAGALLGGVMARYYGLTAPYWIGFALAACVTAATWKVFDSATVSAAYASTERDGSQATQASERVVQK